MTSLKSGPTSSTLYRRSTSTMCKLRYWDRVTEQARQTRPNSGGGGVAEGQPRFDKGGLQ